MNTNREKLIEISNKAREIRESLPQEYETLNDVIVEHIYKDEVNRVFHTYKYWLENGFQVKKGQKAFLIWGKKRKNKENTEPNENKDTEPNYSFFPLAFLFSNAQIRPIKV